MLTLGIESTCDETGASVVLDGKTILSNVVASSAEIHAQYGGVFPELAAQGQIEAIRPVVEEALKQANVTGTDLDLIAVAKGPGLIGSLLVGLQFAKGLSIAWNKPLIGVNHVEAHLYAAMMQTDIPLPALGLVLSGGHTLMLLIRNLGDYTLVGTTRDDAIGEAFDKVGTLLGLKYPGGPEVEKLARQGNPSKIKFSAGNVKGHPLDFSFSGLKTAVLYALRDKTLHGPDVAAAFQETAFRDVVEKAQTAMKQFGCKALVVGGGVCNNLKLRELLPDAFYPPKELTLDNAAMIAGLGTAQFLRTGISDSLDLSAMPRIPFV